MVLTKPGVARSRDVSEHVLSLQRLSRDLLQYLETYGPYHTIDKFIGVRICMRARASCIAYNTNKS